MIIRWYEVSGHRWSRTTVSAISPLRTWPRSYRWNDVARWARLAAGLGNYKYVNNIVKHFTEAVLTVLHRLGASLSLRRLSLYFSISISYSKHYHPHIVCDYALVLILIALPCALTPYVCDHVTIGLHCPQTLRCCQPVIHWWCCWYGYACIAHCLSSGYVLVSGFPDLWNNISSLSSWWASGLLACRLASPCRFWVPEFSVLSPLRVLLILFVEGGVLETPAHPRFSRCRR